jgi:formylmethanofuran dehydrogenase subunit B
MTSVVESIESIESIGTMYKMSGLKNSAKDFMTAAMSDHSVVTVQKLKYYFTTET